jgi:lipoate-protein ligase A
MSGTSPRDRFPPYALDDDLLARVREDGRPRVRVYVSPETMVVLGAGSKPELELHEDACREDGVPVFKRRGGGCAVVLDPGNVIVSTALGGMPYGHHQRHFDALTDWLIAALATIGCAGVTRKGICDLALGDRKVGGACLYRFKDLLYYTTSLLVAPDMTRVARYLKHPPREPDYRCGRSHQEFMGTLASLSGAVRVAADLRRVLESPAGLTSE